MPESTVARKPWPHWLAVLAVIFWPLAALLLVWMTGMAISTGVALDFVAVLDVFWLVVGGIWLANYRWHRASTPAPPVSP